MDRGGGGGGDGIPEEYHITYGSLPLLVMMQM